MFYKKSAMVYGVMMLYGAFTCSCDAFNMNIKGFNIMEEQAEFNCPVKKNETGGVISIDEREEPGDLSRMAVILSRGGSGSR